MRRSTARALVVVAVLAGLFGMHGLTSGHAAMGTGAPVTSTESMAQQMAEQVAAPLPPSPIRTATVSLLAGQSDTGGAGHAAHTGMTSTSCVAVLAAAVVLALSVFRRLVARRRAGPCGPSGHRAVTRRVAPRVVVAPRALSLFELCVMRV